MSYVQPEINLEAFHCPLCGVFSHMKWYSFGRNTVPRPYTEAQCAHCTESTLWKIEKREDDGRGFIIPSKGYMLYPDTGTAPLPAADMPHDVASDYKEAATIFSKSPRGAAALLRLALQKLCRHLKKSGENINEDIRALATDNVLSHDVIKVADTVRIAGNNAVHPGEMSDEDVDYVASKMFYLLNFIVNKAITEPKELERLYNLIPEGPRKSAEKRDAKSKVV
jgi:hypothetical protein